MKNTLLFILLLGTGNFGFSQTVNSSWVPASGNQILSFVNAASVNVSAEGAGQTWNFSSTVVDSVSTVSFSVPSVSSLGQTNFPGAGLVERNTYSGFEKFVYWQAQANSIQELGYFSGNQTDSLYDVASNPRTFLQFPLSLNSTFIDDYVFNNNYNGSVSTVTSGSISATVDATGSIILPGNIVIDDVIRVKTIDNYGVAPTIPIPPPFPTGNIVSYKWISSTYPGVVLASLSIANFDNQGSVSTAYFSVPATVGINNNPSNEAIVFPQPATTSVAINADNGYRFSSIVLFDISGKEVSPDQIDGYGTSKLEIGIESFASGIYFYRSFDSNGNTLTGKIVKQ